jgi:hypothetical protein
MTSSSKNASKDGLLYNYRKALEGTLRLGALPLSFWRVLYPLRCVQVEGEQRQATDFHPIELLIERGIEQAGLSSLNELRAFFQLKLPFIEGLVNRLRAIGHIEQNGQRLALTALGRQSLDDRRCYQRLLTRHVLYFDAFEGQPLTRAHYRLQVYDAAIAADPGRFFAPYPIYPSWQPKSALDVLCERPDRRAYNVPDEIEQLRVVASDNLAYMPIYVVRRRDDPALNLPRLLAFGRLSGYRDQTLEVPLNINQTLAMKFRDTPPSAIHDAVASYMKRQNMAAADWSFEQSGLQGAQVTVRKQSVIRAHLPPNQRKGIALRDIGQYIELGGDKQIDACVWMTCDNAEIRTEAVIWQAADWLQRTPSELSPDDVRRWLAETSRRSAVPAPSFEDVLQVAQQRGLGQAAERLDLLVAEAGQNESATGEQQPEHMKQMGL